jgi:chromosome partitioning protein
MTTSKWTITFLQRKGGTGKSTAALNLAHVCAVLGYRVLLIDIDDQQNATSSISQHIRADLTIADLLLKDEVRVVDVAVRTGWEDVWIIPASPNLSGALKHLDSEVGGHLVLKEKLQDAEEYDICLLDNSPSLNILNIASLCASTHLFIPLSSKYFSLQGLGQTLSAYDKVKKRLNPGLELLGMAFVIHDKRSILANEVVGRVQKQYPSLMFQSMVGVNIKIEEAQVKKQSILTYATEDRGAEQYRELGIEMIDRLKAGTPYDILPKKEAAYG